MRAADVCAEALGSTTHIGTVTPMKHLIEALVL